jgi:5-methylcytosine-specific restriction protein A
MSRAWKHGSSAAWRRMRLAVLSEEPVCHWCRSAPATEADHVIPRAAGGSDARTNLVGCCRDCNLARAVGCRSARPSRAW